MQSFFAGIFIRKWPAKLFYVAMVLSEPGNLSNAPVLSEPITTAYVSNAEQYSPISCAAYPCLTVVIPVYQPPVPVKIFSFNSAILSSASEITWLICLEGAGVH